MRFLGSLFCDPIAQGHRSTGPSRPVTKKSVLWSMVARLRGFAAPKRPSSFQKHDVIPICVFRCEREFVPYAIYRARKQQCKQVRKAGRQTCRKQVGMKGTEGTEGKEGRNEVSSGRSRTHATSRRALQEPIAFLSRKISACVYPGILTDWDNFSQVVCDFGPDREGDCHDRPVRNEMKRGGSFSALNSMKGLCQSSLIDHLWVRN